MTSHYSRTERSLIAVLILVITFSFGVLAGCDALSTDPEPRTIILEFDADAIGLPGRTRTVRQAYSVPEITEAVVEAGDVLAAWRNGSEGEWAPMPTPHGTGVLSYTYTVGQLVVEKEDIETIARQDIPDGQVKVTVIAP